MNPRWKIPIPVAFIYVCEKCGKVLVGRMNISPNDGSSEPYVKPECCHETHHIASVDPWIILERIGNGEDFMDAVTGDRRTTQEKLNTLTSLLCS